MVAILSPAEVETWEAHALKPGAVQASCFDAAQAIALALAYAAVRRDP
jgi:hypothetical protein